MPVFRRSHYDYTIAILCAIEFEMSAVRYMLDEEHPRLPSFQGDPNMYQLGMLSGHNVVLACLPGTQGKGAAAVAATNLERTFANIRWRFFVGIGGGVPGTPHNIRLGDVVVSMPDGIHGGVVQYDLGKSTVDGFIRKGFLCAPPPDLRNAVTTLQSNHRAYGNRVNYFVSGMVRKWKRLAGYQRPKDRTERNLGPRIHYGLIASGDSVIKNTAVRDEIRRREGDILCFEMEAAGLMTDLPALVIRGIADYANPKKNDLWQYNAAAAAAAACTKELLALLSPESVMLATPINSRSRSYYNAYGQNLTRSNTAFY
ncbi:nucleoside phosphorylase domain-containing protein [Annulohypoxylon moriforme]|nr:nucleoside phosphorylase domain-containing protein [Annulohypoxylon moriforme]